jgi:hypothetical protein
MFRGRPRVLARGQFKTLRHFGFVNWPRLIFQPIYLKFHRSNMVHFFCGFSFALMPPILRVEFSSIKLP